MSNRWCLAALGLVTIAGSLIGAVFGWARTGPCWCCTNEELR